MHTAGIGGANYGGGTPTFSVFTILFVLFVGLFLAMSFAWMNRGSTNTESVSTAREWRWAWGIVFLANLPVPLFFGFLATANPGAIGMLAGIVATWLTGHIAVCRVPAIRGPLVIGGVCVALSQIIPVVQIVAGLLAIGVVTGEKQAMSVGAGLGVTLLTASLLATVALIFGAVVRGLGLLIEGRISRNQH